MLRLSQYSWSGRRGRECRKEEWELYQAVKPNKLSKTEEVFVLEKEKKWWSPVFQRPIYVNQGRSGWHSGGTYSNRQGDGKPEEAQGQVKRVKRSSLFKGGSLGGKSSWWQWQWAEKEEGIQGPATTNFDMKHARQVQPEPEPEPQIRLPGHTRVPVCSSGIARRRKEGLSEELPGWDEDARARRSDRAPIAPIPKSLEKYRDQRPSGPKKQSRDLL
ncbi:hypothetical protein EDB82DRAFT_480628 [Fusarium venenatum]|uniref:uncharacterized protein n=1 Tax=Fusarium venenatum TaxID=56646 RepID=UPI001DB33CED|nr:hypothetical protein EDB82DRAFT_480628 [Fusarium venenatum]